MNHSVRVRVGGGLASYRELLQVYVDGKEVSEVASAGFPQQFEYRHSVQSPIQGHQYVVSFRYRGASFFTKVGMVSGVIRSPAVHQRVHNKEEIRLVWNGEHSPSSVAVDTRFFGLKGAGGCALSYQPKTKAKTNNLFVPVWSPSGQKPPCVGEAKVSWLRKESMSSPFLELNVTKMTSRLQPFHIQ